MRVLGVNRILNWLQIVDSKIYTCPTKEVDGELLFRYKNKWHRAIDYSYEKPTNSILKMEKHYREYSKVSHSNASRLILYAT